MTSVITTTRHSAFVRHGLLLLSLYSAIVAGNSHASDKLTQLGDIQNASYILSDNQGRPIVALRGQEPLIPASTTKLLTAWLALMHWGQDHHFATRISLDRDTATLWIEGSGDPFLVSEEIELIAEAILALNPRAIDKIGLDASLFKADLVVPGATTTNNPYDAIPSPIAANFNTLNLKQENGQLVSAEPQTPLTAFSHGFSDQISGKNLRINTGRRSQDAERYFAELLAEMLRRKGVTVGQQIIWGEYVAGPDELVYRNSRTLGEVVQAMLKYSTNFIANQLILALAAEHSGQAADFNSVQRYMESTSRDHFGWQNLVILEGAGLSRQNRLSAQQLLELLLAFRPWLKFLPEVETDIHAKTGTLTGVSSLAGYIQQADKPLRFFALLINDTVPSRFTRDIALELAELD